MFCSPYGDSKHLRFCWSTEKQLLLDINISARVFAGHVCCRRLSRLTPRDFRDGLCRDHSYRLWQLWRWASVKREQYWPGVFLSSFCVGFMHYFCDLCVCFWSLCWNVVLSSKSTLLHYVDSGPVNRIGAMRFAILSEALLETCHQKQWFSTCVSRIRSGRVADSL